MLTDIGGRIQFLLKINNDKASNLARAINVSPATMSRLISTNRIPKIKSILEDIRHYFRTDDEWFDSGILLEFAHKCNFQFIEEDDECPNCGSKITNFIHPSIKLTTFDFSPELIYKLNYLSDYRYLLYKIDMEISKTKQLESDSFENIELIEKIIDSKEKTFSKLNKLGSEYDKLVRIESLKKFSFELSLDEVFDNFYWDETYGLPDFVVQSEKIYGFVPLK